MVSHQGNELIPQEQAQVLSAQHTWKPGLTTTHPAKHRHAHLLHARLTCPSQRHWFSQHRGCLLHPLHRVRHSATENLTSQSTGESTAPPQQPVGTSATGQKAAPEAPCAKGKGGDEPWLCPCQRGADTIPPGCSSPAPTSSVPAHPQTLLTFSLLCPGKAPHRPRTKE